MSPDPVLFQAAVDGFMDDGHTRQEAVSLAYQSMANTPNTTNTVNTNNRSNGSNSKADTLSPPVGPVGLLASPTPPNTHTNTQREKKDQVREGGQHPNTPEGGMTRPSVRERFLLMSVADNVASRPPTKWVVEGLIPEGLTLLAGPSKAGKSFVCLDVGAGVAAGDQVLGGMVPEPGDVMYLALEDTSSRIVDRLSSRSPDRGEWPWDRLTIVTHDMRDEQPLGNLIHQWIDEVDKPVMVIVDTIARFGGQGGRTGYQADVEWMSKFHDVAVTNHIAMVAVTHTNQMKLEEKDDWFNKISGTTGIVGTADNVFLLDAQRGEPEGRLLFSGRDIDEGELALRRVGPWWQVTDQLRGRRGDKSVSMGDWIIQAGREVSTSEVAEAFSMTNDKASVYLGRLVKAGVIRRVRTGWFEAI